MALVTMELPGLRMPRIVMQVCEASMTQMARPTKGRKWCSQIEWKGMFRSRTIWL